VELASAEYRNTLRLLGNEDGLDHGDVTVVLSNGESFRASTAACTWLGDLGMAARLPDGRLRFMPAASVLYVEDAPAVSKATHDEASACRSAGGGVAVADAPTNGHAPAAGGRGVAPCEDQIGICCPARRTRLRP
jgi:hypothetical protein